MQRNVQNFKDKQVQVKLKIGTNGLKRLKLFVNTPMTENVCNIHFLYILCFTLYKHYTMKTTILLFLFILPAVTLQAQKAKEVEPAVLECQYKYYVKHAYKQKGQPAEDLMILRIGENASQFFSFYTHYNDSLWNDPMGKKIAMQLTMNAIRSKSYDQIPKVRTTLEYIYKSYPAKGQLTTYTTGGEKSFSLFYTEEDKGQEWDIQDSVKTIMDYTCQLATTRFRGRNWEAWFTTNIPSNNGPWKFGGLPGLILEVYDTEDEYHYTLSGIRTEGLKAVTFYNYWEKEHEKADRKKFLKKERERICNSPDSLLAADKWDFMEKDYNE